MTNPHPRPLSRLKIRVRLDLLPRRRECEPRQEQVESDPNLPRQRGEGQGVRGVST
jgi:hypothetical protein